MGRPPDPEPSKCARPHAGSSLASVSCPSTSSYTAVGNTNHGTVLAELWNGTTWSIQPTPNPSGRHWPNPELSGVSCPSATECLAVGSYLDSKSVLQTLVERWNGTTWGIERRHVGVQDTPNPRGNGDSAFFGVSCPTSLDCTVVGGYGEIVPQLRVTLAEHI